MESKKEIDREVVVEFYRYHDREGFCGVSIDLDVFVLLRETERGYWIINKSYIKWPDNSQERHKRWISKTSRKRYAYPDKKDAWINFKTRKVRQIALNKMWLAKANKALSKAEYIEEFKPDFIK